MDNKIPPRHRRLKTEMGNMGKLIHDSSFVSFQCSPQDLPEEYEVTFSCLGLISEPKWKEAQLPPDWRRSELPPWIGDHHVAHIYLPADYPRLPPKILFKTPIFHPNIVTIDMAELVKQLSGMVEIGEENLNRLIQSLPETHHIFTSYICLDGLKPKEEKGNYSQRLTLYDICCELGQMIMYQRYNTADPLNKEAAQWTSWAENQLNMLPIDNRAFLDMLPPVIRVWEDESADLNIEILEENQEK